MNIILKQDVANLGYADDVVKVKSGYALNYLIPRGIATAATPSALKQLEETKRQRAHKVQKLIADAETLKAAIEAAKIVVPVKVSEAGKAYGSVTAAQLADALVAAGVNVDKKDIAIHAKEVRELGTYEATVACYKDVKAALEFQVVSDSVNEAPEATEPAAETPEA